ncbi:uncharacterized protein LOC129759444, partial [Uranotaenia lowii]|uniref:uncharacterized protein LOC129759444 n=1 Tax=Uranotaenia lowii TaxID=190385 RepID=UPI00247A1840
METTNYRYPISQSSSWSSWILFTLAIAMSIVSSAAFDDHYAEYDTKYHELESSEGLTTEQALPVETIRTNWDESHASDQISTTETFLPGEEEDYPGNWYDYYCRDDLCIQYDQFGQMVRKKHVACGHDGSFAEDCPTGRTLFRIDPQIKAFI